MSMSENQEKIVFSENSSLKRYIPYFIALVAVSFLSFTGWYIFTAFFVGASTSVRIEAPKKIEKTLKESTIESYANEFEFEDTEQFIYRGTTEVPASTVTTEVVDVPEGVESIQFIISVDKAVGNSLIDPKKVVYETINANSTVATQKYRTFFVDKPMSGRWVIEFVNRNTEEPSLAVISVKINGYDASINVAVDVVDDNVVSITSLVMNSEDVVTDANVVVELESQNKASKKYRLYDDGEHDDGKADDGIYAIKTDPLIPGGYFVVVHADIDGTTIMGIDSVYIETKAKGV